MPLHGDDFRFIDAGLRDAFKGVVHLYAAQNDGNIILSGLEVTQSGGQVFVSEGYVCLDYEVRFLPASSLSVSGSTASLNIVADNYYEPNGNDVFEDGVSRDTYAVRRAKIVNGLTDANDFPLVGAWRMADAVREIVNPEQKENITTFVGSWSSSEAVKVNIIGERVYLTGRITGGGTNGDVFSIPEGYHPAINIFLPVAMLIGGDSKIGIFKVSSDGVCSVFTEGSQVNLTSSDFVSFGNVSWATY